MKRRYLVIIFVILTIVLYFIDDSVDLYYELYEFIPDSIALIFDLFEELFPIALAALITFVIWLISKCIGGSKVGAQSDNKKEDKQSLKVAVSECKETEEEKKKQIEEEVVKQQEEKKRLEAEAKSFDWDYDNNTHTLTISGNGHMPKGWHPWPEQLVISRLVIKDGVLSIPDKDNTKCFNGIDCIDLGNTIQSIGKSAFQGHRQRGFKFPKSLIEIGEEAFTYRQKNEYSARYICEANIKKIGSNAFCRASTVCFKSPTPITISKDSLNGVQKIYIPTGCFKKYITAPIWAEYVNIIEEMDVELMDSTFKCYAANAKEYAKLKAVEEEKKRLEEEKKRKEEEERQKVEQERKKAEEEKEERQKVEQERKKAEEEKEERQKVEQERKKAEEEKKRKEEESFDWDYDQSSQTLTISGQGHMPNDWHPWGNIRVDNLIIKDGVVSISPNAFDLNHLNSYGLQIEFGNTLQIIGDRAFLNQRISGISVFPETLISIGEKAFLNQRIKGVFVSPETLIRLGDKFNTDFQTFCFKSQNPPSIADLSFLPMAVEILFIPVGCLKKYVSSSKEWRSLAVKIEEKDVSLMHSSLELVIMEAENKRKEEERKKEEEEHRKAEEEKKRKEEEKKRKEEEKRQKAEEEEYRAKCEAELRKEMGL